MYSLRCPARRTASSVHHFTFAELSVTKQQHQRSFHLSASVCMRVCFCLCVRGRSSHKSRTRFTAVQQQNKYCSSRL